MKKKRAGTSLDGVFFKSEKDPKWATAYENAGIEVRMAIRIAKARGKARLTPGQELIAGLKEAVDHARGAKKLRTSTLARAR